MIAIIATLTKATHWNVKIPNFMALRMWSNLIITSIPEEAFFRGFIQAKLCTYFRKTKKGNILSLLLTSTLFALPHLSWSPNPIILGFVFIAGLLYGGVYLYCAKIESTILTHFFLNLIHMIFFQYHAL